MNPLHRRELFRLGLGSLLTPSIARAMPGLRLLEATPAVGVDKLLVVFQRGGNDGINTVVPAFLGSGDPSYTAMRKTLTSQAWIDPVTLLPIAGSTYAGFNPVLSELGGAPGTPDANGHLVTMHQVGDPEALKSHFTGMEKIELGGGPLMGPSGWLARLIGVGGFDGALAGASVSPLMQRSLRSLTNPQVHIRDVLGFKAEALDPALASSFGVPPATDAQVAVDGIGQKLFAAHQVVQQMLLPFPLPQPDKTGLPPSTLGEAFLDDLFGAFLLLELTTCRVAAVEIGGWDTHENQTQRQNDLLRWLGRGLRWLYDNTVNSAGIRLLTLVMTEFGRTVAVNGTNGCDHGVGGLWLAMGADVKGGLYNCAATAGTKGAAWTNMNLLPGINSGVPAANSCKVETHYLTVLREVVQKRFGITNADLPRVLPGINGVSGSLATPLNFLI